MAGPRGLRRNLSGSPGEDRMRREQSTDLAPVVSCPLLAGVAVKGVELTTGNTTRVVHKLGRTPVGYLLTRIRDGVPDFGEVSLDEKAATFAANTDVTVDFWFFLWPWKHSS